MPTLRYPGWLILLLVTGCVPAIRAERSSPGLIADAPLRDAHLDRLYFGRGMSDGRTVTGEQWSIFLAEVVTFHYPCGLTHWEGSGQWRAGGGEIVHEGTFILELVPCGDTSPDAIPRLVEEYRRRFDQESVLHVRQEAQISF